MKFKFSLFMILLMQTITLLYAQTPDIELLKKKYQSEKNDLARINIGYNISYEWLFINPDSALEIAQRNLAEAFKLKLDSGIAYGYSHLAMAYWFQKKIETAEGYFLLSNSKSETIGLIANIAANDGNLALMYKKQGRLDEAIKLTLNADSIFKVLQDSFNIYKNKTSLAGLYYKRDNPNTALNYILEAIEFNENHQDTFALSFAYNQAGGIYFQLKDYANAIRNYEKARYYDSLTVRVNNLPEIYSNLSTVYIKGLKNLRLAEIYNAKAINSSAPEDLKKATAIYRNNLAEIAMLRNNYSEALKILEDLYETQMQEFDSYNQAALINELAEAYFKTGNIQEAKKYSKLAYFKSVEIESILNQIHAQKSLYLIDSAEGNYKAALEHLLSYTALEDSISNLDYQQKIADLNIQYETELTKHENELLLHDNDLNSQRIRSYRIILIFSIFVGALLVTFLIMFARKRNQLHILNERLALKASALAESNKTKDLIFSVIAHDLKNSISGQQQLLEALYNHPEMLTPEMKEESMDLLYDNSKNTYQLLLNLLDWSFTKSGKIKKEASPFLAKKSCIIASANILPLMKKKNINFKIDISDELTINNDIKLFSSVVFNLVSNAYKFTPSGGEVKIVATSLADSTTRIQVIDSGIGMPQEKIDQILAGIAQKSQEGTNHEHGIGIGLTICVYFIELMEGKLNITSSLNQGSCFEFVI